ncbi:hypothetical protein [Mycobacterium sp. IDR2000157661]|uniref:hypothetical protein n=1 Tax=Mycobacterium sp. IDR2000157661 TaxID=2867005 RepID=UPI001EECB30B|nr:hypothetical protein [Mycobacterium sp. IDR2000157661]ULE32520.1 hypothetical protein K3G64_20815 [Mycobacterium sp. IDR2000157661]
MAFDTMSIESTLRLVFIGGFLALLILSLAMDEDSYARRSTRRRRRAGKVQTASDGSGAEADRTTIASRSRAAKEKVG